MTRKLFLIFAAVLFNAIGYCRGLKYTEAKWWRVLDGAQKIVQCRLCPRRCVLRADQRGYCTVRINRGGKLFTLTYNRPVSLAVDPIEKKPVFHMLPGTKNFSLATAGCNLRCIHCQNWQISQRMPEEIRAYDITPAEIVKLAKESGSESIAYTYVEPVIFYEYMLDIAKEAKKQGIRNIMVTSGYINLEPLEELTKYIDVFRVDLKGFSEQFYQKLAAGSLQPVLDTLKFLKKKGCHIEVINLVIPTMNDDMAQIKKMSLWLKENLGAETPLFFSRFHPRHKLTALTSTPVKTLESAHRVATSVGMKFVYIGNVPGHPAESTYCPDCKKVLIKRVGYTVLENNLTNGKCKFCKRKIPGIWK